MTITTPTGWVFQANSVTTMRFFRTAKFALPSLARAAGAPTTTSTRGAASSFAGLTPLMSLHNPIHRPAHSTMPHSRRAMLSTLYPAKRRYATSALEGLPTTPRPGEDILPVVDSLRNKGLGEGIDMSRTAVFYVHHALRTSVNVIDTMMAWGLKPKNTFVLGKKYSENAAVVDTMLDRGVHYRRCSEQARLGQFNAMFVKDVNALWDQVSSEYEKRPEDIDQIIVLDHGGYGSSYMPADLQRMYPVMGLEKTTAGVIKHDIEGGAPLPLVNVAESAAKKHIESPMIAEASWRKLMENVGDIPKNKVCGIAGFGDIGRAVAAKLKSQGYKVNVYDKHYISPNYNEIYNVVKSFDTLVLTSDVVFGCSGRDITCCIDPLKNAISDKDFISASSEDRECLTLLRAINKQYYDKLRSRIEYCIDPLADAVFQTNNGANIKVHRGGFPINFDATGESVPAEDIQLTRALTLAGVMQIMRFLKNNDMNPPNVGLYALDPELQSEIAVKWLANHGNGRYNDQALPSFQDTEWIEEHSKGEPFVADHERSPANDCDASPKFKSLLERDHIFYNPPSQEEDTSEVKSSIS